MKTDPRQACANEQQRLLWALVHDAVAHPLMALLGWPKWALRFHDWTSQKAWPRAQKRQGKGIVHRTLVFEHAQMVEKELRRQGCPFCTTAEPHYHDDGRIFYIYEVEKLG